MLQICLANEKAQESRPIRVPDLLAFLCSLSIYLVNPYDMDDESTRLTCCLKTLSCSTIVVRTESLLSRTQCSSIGSSKIIATGNLQMLAGTQNGRKLAQFYPQHPLLISEPMKQTAPFCISPRAYDQRVLSKTLGE